MRIPNEQIIPFVPLTFRNPLDGLSSCVPTLMKASAGEELLWHPPERRVGPISKNITVRTIST